MEIEYDNFIKSLKFKAALLEQLLNCREQLDLEKEFDQLEWKFLHKITSIVEENILDTIELNGGILNWKLNMDSK